MIGTVSYFHTPNSRQGFCALFTNGTTFVQFQTGPGNYNLWKAATEQGRFWNDNFYTFPVAHYTSWAAIDATGESAVVEVSAGPLPWTVTDSFALS